MFKRNILITLLLIISTGCVQLTPDYIRGSSYERALMLYKEGSLPEAKRMAEGIEKGAPDYTSAQQLLSDLSTLMAKVADTHIRLGNEYEKAGIYAMAAREYATALDFRPDDKRLAERLRVVEEGRLYKASNKVTDKPKKGAGWRATGIKKAVKKSKSTTKIVSEHYKKGTVFLESGMFSEAIEEFNLVVDISPSYKDAAELLAAAYYGRGLLHLESKEYIKSIDDFTALLELRSPFRDTQKLLSRAKKERDLIIDFHLKKGIEHFQKEEMEDAIKEWDKVLELSPGNKAALDYKYRAMTILERLKVIKEERQ